MAEDYTVLGMMSGTSLDGLDLCLAAFRFDKGWSFRILAAETRPYDPATKSFLISCYDGEIAHLGHAHASYGQFLGEQARDFCLKTGITPELISSHGHTILHRPEDRTTFQLGDGRRIAAISGLPVVSDFRTADVAMGGQGAPLVPVGDELLFSEYDACLNLGGFSNISMKREGRRIAFDICPVNILLDRFAGLRGLDYDSGGDLARSGEVDEVLFKRLEALPFYRQEGPRSLGREWVEEQVDPLITGRDDAETLLRTVVEHIASRIADISERYAIRDILLSGGGAFNGFLVERIRSRSDAAISLPDPLLISYKEALVFGLLGVLRIREEVNVLASVTGAMEDHSSGMLHMP